MFNTGLKKAAVVAAMSSTLGATVLASPAFAAPAPSCISSYVSKGVVTQTAHMTNNCNSTYKVQFVWAFGLDGQVCANLPSGFSRSETVPIAPRRFEGVKLC